MFKNNKEKRNSCNFSIRNSRLSISGSRIQIFLFYYSVHFSDVVLGNRRTEKRSTFFFRALDGSPFPELFPNPAGG